MADVNPNQDLRFKEIMRRLIPGGYCFVFLHIVYVFYGVGTCDLYEKVACVANGTGATRYSLIVIAAYIIGFVNNTIASSVERMLYKNNYITRPSRLVLTKDSKYRMDKSVDVIRKSGVSVIGENVCQEQAMKILRIAKVSIQRKDNMVEEMFHQSIMARNLLCMHIISALVAVALFAIPFDLSHILFFFVVVFIIGWLFWKEWRRKNIVYVRNVFEEYIMSKHSN